MLLACDKPSGISSFDVVKIIRTHFQSKVGHSGTLDPMASGLMILGVGNGTKQLTSLIGMDKCYQTTIDFSLLTDTRDANFWDYQERFEVRDHHLQKDGNLIPSPDLTTIIKHLETLIYTPNQETLLPLPTFSAKKHNGKRLYHAARKGKAEQQQKPMKIYNFKVLDYSFPLLTVKIEVGSGTYIRSIGYRLGQQLGLGGTLIELERLSIGPRNLTDISKNSFAQGRIKGAERTIYFEEIRRETNII